MFAHKTCPLAAAVVLILMAHATFAQLNDHNSDEIAIKVEKQWQGRVQDRMNLKSQIIRESKEFRRLWESTHPEKEPLPKVIFEGKSVLFVIAGPPPIQEAAVVGDLSLRVQKTKGKKAGLVALFTIKVDSKYDKGHTFLFAVLDHPLKAREIDDLEVEKRPGRFRVDKAESGEIAYSIDKNGKAQLSGVWMQTQGVLIYELK